MKKSILPFIEKPSRYLGGEVGSYSKDPAGVALRFALAFPDVYEVGMSHLGHRILYSLLNNHPQVFAERVYAPWFDVDKALGEAALPLTTLETGTALSEFDAVGFTYNYELAATNILAMLRLGGIPLRAEQRSDDDPVVIVGGPCAANPEPISIFVDVVFVGDGEDAAIEIADSLIATKGQPRAKRLAALAKIEGVYVPTMYEVSYNDDGAIDKLEGPTPYPSRRIVTDLNKTPVPDRELIPHARAVHDRLAVEVARGCTRGCRFCQAGYLYRPVREREAANVALRIEQGLGIGGFEEVSLMSLSSGDYTCIRPLITELIRAKQPQQVAVALPSLRVESLTPELIEQISKIKRTGFTLAPEAGTERLRGVLNKGFTDDEIFTTVDEVFSKGWELVKLYFMIGLPTQTDEDLQGIVRLSRQVLSIGKRNTKRARVNVNVGVFVPKPHTPFQWAQQISLEEAKRQYDYLHSAFAKSKITLKHSRPQMSVVEGALARGNRKTGEAIERVFLAGGKFDAWSEGFRLERWQQGFADAGLDLERARSWAPPTKGRLPWEIVDPVLGRKFLEKQWEIAQSGELSEDCRGGECLGCGVCDDEIEMKLADLESPGMTFDNAVGTLSSDLRFRYRIRYSKTGKSRFLAHLELSSSILRAFRHAKLPLHYSQGFSPAPKVAFGPPLPLGVESLDEYLDLQLTSSLDPRDILESVNPAYLPEGIRLLECSPIALKDSSIFADMDRMNYLVDMTAIDELTGEKVQAQIEDFHSRETYRFEQIRLNKKPKIVDLKQLVVELKLISDDTLSITLKMTETGSIGIFIALAELLGLTPDQARTLSVVKQSSRFDSQS